MSFQRSAALPFPQVLVVARQCISGTLGNLLLARPAASVGARNRGKFPTPLAGSHRKKQARTAKDPAVKNFASETLPTLEDHLKEARNVDRQVAGTAMMHKAVPHTPSGS